MKRIRMTLIAVTAIWMLLFMFGVFADDYYGISGKSYELDDGSSFVIAEESSSTELCYGEDSIGGVLIAGEIDTMSTYAGVPAYGTAEELTLCFSYDGEHGDTSDEWHVVSSNAKTVAGVTLSKQINKGSFIVQKSVDGLKWETVSESTNILQKKKVGIIEYYTIPLDDISSGCYYRVMVAYRMEHKVETNKVMGFIPKGTYEYREFVEVYDLYVCYDQDSVILRDIMTGEQLPLAATVKDGFIIDKNGKEISVYSSKDGAAAESVKDLTSVCEPGSYTITAKTDLNTRVEHHITVSDGLNMTTLSPKVYDNGTDGEYQQTNPVSGQTDFGMKSLTTLTLAQRASTDTTISVVDGYAAYGIKGDSVGLYMRLNDMAAATANGWSVNADAWGKKQNQTVNGTWVGAVGTGALIVQTSKDGEVWQDIKKEGYSDGLYTTDFHTHYGNSGDVLIYTPSGDDIINGVYVRIFYAYEMSRGTAKTETRYLEGYEFYLCSSELGAVTFHNLSLEETTDENAGEDAEAEVTMYKKAESLLSGSGTASGFTIDTTLNPTVKCSVYRNGQQIAMPTNKEFTAPGEYKIKLESMVGDSETVYIYVDPQNSESALEKYFGESFITGKRIFSRGDYPVYEGGLTEYNVKAIDEYYLPVSGTVENTTIGTTFDVVAGNADICETLTEPGQYVAVFTTRQNDELPGDYRVFTFRFEIIAEGTAPGPVVNQENLAEYAKDNVSDAYPMYYGLTYSSAASGNITLAFATREAAVEYAYNYERGMVEKQEDGTYRYTGSFIVAQKEKYDSAWDLTDAMYFFAEQAVQELYFDMSDNFTYLTLDEDTISHVENLRTLELSRSVTLFADGEKEQCCDTGLLPVFGEKPFAYLTPGINGGAETGTFDFEFVRDKYGCDSESVTIVDCNGKAYDIEYNRGVAEQLDEMDCPSGIVTIKESTVYGDTTSYQAVYIANGENDATVTLAYYEDGAEKTKAINQAVDGARIEVDAFRIDSIVSELDPYTMISVSRGGRTSYYVADQIANGAWSEQGEYLLKITNRIGSSYSVTIEVRESNHATVTFSGAGTEDAQAIITFLGAEDVALPQLTRYGYELVGFTDEEGALYNEETMDILFKGTRVLEAVWQAKQYTLYMTDADGKELAPATLIDFGGSYELEPPEMDAGIEFLGWTRNGEVIDELKVDTEGDITLVAKVAMSETEHSNEPNDKPWMIIVVIGCVIVAGIGIFARKRKKNAVGAGEQEGAQEE